jgi:hypothetical protein
MRCHMTIKGIYMVTILDYSSRKTIRIPTQRTCYSNYIRYPYTPHHRHRSRIHPSIVVLRFFQHLILAYLLTCNILLMFLTCVSRKLAESRSLRIAGPWKEEGKGE